MPSQRHIQNFQRSWANHKSWGRGGDTNLLFGQIFMKLHENDKKIHHCKQRHYQSSPHLSSIHREQTGKRKLNHVKGIHVLSHTITLTRSNFYHPQHSCGKVIFPQASVILSTGWGGGEGVYPSRHCMLGYTHPSCPVHAGIHAPPLRMVHILLECILVTINYTF